MRNLAVTVFGVIPASTLCSFVLPLLIELLGQFVERGGRELLLDVVWCVMAVIGTFALFFSIEKAPGLLRMLGLGCGIAAMIGLDGLNFVSSGPWKLVFVVPLITGVALILEGLHFLAVPKDDSD